MNQRAIDIESEMNQVLMTVKNTEEVFRYKLVQNLRADLLKQIPSFDMNEERKSYFLHQLANTHEIEELLSLVQDVNKKQLSAKQDLVLLSRTAQGLAWVQRSIQ